MNITIEQMIKVVKQATQELDVVVPDYYSHNSTENKTITYVDADALVWWLQELLGEQA
jgi:hypothetical protein